MKMLDQDREAKSAIMNDFVDESLRFWDNGTVRSYESGTKYGLGRPVSEVTMLRLAFHDCLTYKDGTGGCDGEYSISQE